MKISDAFGLLADDKFKIAFIALLASLLTLFGVPEKKQTECFVLIGAVSSVLIAAKGYEQGKLNEGTVPDGSKSSTPPQQVNIITPPAESAPPYPKDPNQKSDSSSSSGSGTGRTLGLLLVFGLTMCMVGCSTSESFKVGMRAAGPLIADEGKRYTVGDGTLSTADTAAQTAQAERLKAETIGTCEYIEVKTAWLDVKPWYLRYVRQDQRLTEDERAIVLKTGSQVDALIAEEAKRRRLLFLPE